MLIRTLFGSPSRCVAASNNSYRDIHWFQSSVLGLKFAGGGILKFPAAVAICPFCGLPVWLVSCEELVSPVTEDGVLGMLGVLASLVSLNHANSSSFKFNQRN